MGENVVNCVFLFCVLNQPLHKENTLLCPPCVEAGEGGNMSSWHTDTVNVSLDSHPADTPCMMRHVDA